MTPHIKIGTRASLMAQQQAYLCQKALISMYPAISSSIHLIQSDGDKNQGSLKDFGGKGAFVRNLDRALTNGEIDIAVNCLKDIPKDIERNDDITIAGCLKREDTHDVAITTTNAVLAELPHGSTIGTSSPRRNAQIKRFYPHLNPIPIRGSCDTRIAKMHHGFCDGLIVASAGLKRLALDNFPIESLSEDTFIPAIGAGIITMDCLKSNIEISSIIEKVSDSLTYRLLLVERAFINSIDGSCLSRIAGKASYDFKIDKINFVGCIYNEDGSKEAKTNLNFEFKMLNSAIERCIATLLASGISI
jgi:hydroxymethylbilane synthase